MIDMSEAIEDIEAKKILLQDGACVNLLEQAIGLLKSQHNYINELEANSDRIMQLVREFKMTA